MKRWIWMGGALGLCLLLGAAPGLAAMHSPYNRYSSDEFRLRLGLFTPDGDSEYWHGAESDFTGDASDLQDVVFGGDWIHQVTPFMGLMVSGDFYQGQSDMSYRNFTDTHGHEIVHTTTLEVAPFTAGLVFRLAPEGLPVHPYVGVGGGLYWWHLDEEGDFVDFTGRNDIFTDAFHDDGAVFGYYALAGLDIPISSNFSVFGEARWDRAKDDLNGDFATLGKIDVGGSKYMGGVSWHF